MDEPKCATCRWWDSEATRLIPHHQTGTTGICRQKPPGVAFSGAAQWAVTAAADWCGQHAEAASWPSDEQEAANVAA